MVHWTIANQEARIEPTHWPWTDCWTDKFKVLDKHEAAGLGRIAHRGKCWPSCSTRRPRLWKSANRRRRPPSWDTFTGHYGRRWGRQQQPRRQQQQRQQQQQQQQQQQRQQQYAANRNGDAHPENRNRRIGAFLLFACVCVYVCVCVCVCVLRQVWAGCAGPRFAIAKPARPGARGAGECASATSATRRARLNRLASVGGRISSRSKRRPALFSTSTPLGRSRSSSTPFSPHFLSPLRRGFLGGGGGGARCERRNPDVQQKTERTRQFRFFFYRVMASSSIELALRTKEPSSVESRWLTWDQVRLGQVVASMVLG